MPKKRAKKIGRLNKQGKQGKHRTKKELAQRAAPPLPTAPDVVTAVPPSPKRRKAANACQAPSPKYRGHPAAQFRAQSPTRPNNTMVAGRRKLAKDNNDLANKIDATTTATHREVGGVATAQRVRRCSARSTLLGAFGAGCRTECDAGRRAECDAGRRGSDGVAGSPSALGFRILFGGSAHERAILEGKHLRSVCAACEFTVRAVAP